MSIRGIFRDIWGAKGVGQRFQNQAPDQQKPLGPLTYLKKTPWQSWETRANATFQAPKNRIDGDDLAVTFINHSTFLIQIDGVNLLTDPVWGNRVKPVLGWIGPKARFRQPGLSFDALPPIHHVLVSHNHRDHMELPSLRRLAYEHKAQIFSGLGNADFLKTFGISQAQDMEWYGEPVQLSARLKLYFVPAHHGSQRGITDKDKTLWGGFVLDHPDGAIYFAGDTGWGPHFDEIAKRFPNFRLALLPIGDCYPTEMFSNIHIGPAEALNVHGLMKARSSLAYHHDTFRLTGATQDQARDEMMELLQKENDQKVRFFLPDHGQSFHF